MVYKGRIKDGVIVFDQPLSLPEGTEVVVQVTETKAEPPPTGDKPRKTLAEKFANVIGTINDLPSDFSHNHDHYIHGTPKK